MGSFFIRRPIVAMVLSIVMVLLGLVAMRGLPIAQYPDITPPEVLVEGTFTGASAVDVEQSVATPTEQEVNGVENMIYMKSTNSGDGVMSLRVSFDVGTNLDMANVLTQNRVNQAMPALPDDVKRLGVSVKKSLAFPLLLVTLKSPNGTFDNNFLSNYASINVNDALARIRGVGLVKLFGGSDYALRIWIRPDRLSQMGLTVTDITRAVQQQNVIAPGGQIGGPPAPPGTEFTYAVRTAGRLVTPEQFDDIVVRTNSDGSQVRLKDVGRAELGTKTYTQAGRLNGKPAAVTALYQIPGSNALQLADTVRKTMAEVSKDFPEDLEYDISLDTTLAVTEGINEIMHTLVEAIVLVILVVFVFLQNWRATLIPLLTVPVSLLATFLLFPALGFSINVLSLLGLVLAIGIVVDDAIVVVEAVMHHIEHGKTPREATQQAMKEVTGPVMAIALILAAVFVPVAFLPGITGRLYQQFAITIAISVLFSALNALTLSPALSGLLLLPKSEKKGFLDKFYGVFNRSFEWFTDRYVSCARFLINNMTVSLLFIGGLVAVIVLLGKSIPTGFVPEEDQGYFMVNVKLPDAASMQRTDEVCKQVESIMGQTEGIESYTTVVGYSLLANCAASNNAFFFVSLKEWAERGDRTAAVLTRELNRRFSQEIPQAQAIAFGPPAIPGLGQGAGFSIMIQDRSGATPEYLEEQTQKFVAAALKMPEIGGAFTLFSSRVPQMRAQVDRDKALKLGVAIQDVNTTLGASLGGSYINDFNRFGRQYKVYVQAEPQFRATTEGLNQYFVRSATGEMVPMMTLVDMGPASGPDYTNRFNLYRSAEVTGMPAQGFSSAQAMTALEEVAKETLPPGMTYSWNAMSFQEKAAEGSSAVVFAFALFLVFLVLAAQYESWSLPFSVLLGTPFAVFGAFLGLWLARMQSESYVNNVFAQIGLVMLIGLAAKNAILIVEFARAKFHEGTPLVDAALEGAKLRFRPILMTAFAFILGVVPLLTATGAGAEGRKVMGMAVFAGMSVATVLGVLLIPMLFVMIERIAGNKPGEHAAPEGHGDDAKPADAASAGGH
jgi:HAE1 family hydrophobic/amphiphilic exporter-1